MTAVRMARHHAKLASSARPHNSDADPEVFLTATIAVHSVSMCSSSTGSHALLSRVSRQQLHFQSLVEGLDVAKSEAESPSDKERILGLITRAVGVAQFNKQLQSHVFRAVREAVITRFKTMQTNRRTSGPGGDRVQHTVSIKTI